MFSAAVLQVGVTGVDHALTNVGLARKVVLLGVVVDHQLRMGVG